VEEERHLFFDCEATREAWHVMGLVHIFHSRLNMFDNIRDLIFDICRNEIDSDASKVAVLMWFIWQNRNNYVWNDNKSTAQQVGMQVAQFWQQWAMINGLLDEQQQLVQQQTADNRSQQWQQPPGLLESVTSMLAFTARLELPDGDGAFVIIMDNSNLLELILCIHHLTSWKGKPWLL
jgi:hypothetical protein